MLDIPPASVAQHIHAQADVRLRRADWTNAWPCGMQNPDADEHHRTAGRSVPALWSSEPRSSGCLSRNQKLLRC